MVTVYSHEIRYCVNITTKGVSLAVLMRLSNKENTCENRIFMVEYILEFSDKVEIDIHI